MGACQNSPKCTYIFLVMFRQKPKSHLNWFALPIFFYVNLNVPTFYVTPKNIGRTCAHLLFFMHIKALPKRA
jgi:hypothetical protein